MSNIRDRVQSLRVSSVLNRDSKQYGKQFLLDPSEETCWHSDTSKSQSADGTTVEWIEIEFSQPICAKQIKLMFQGGFVGKTLKFLGKPSDKTEANESDAKAPTDFLEIGQGFPQDVNRVQSFPLSKLIPVSKLLIRIEGSTDFYGRVVIYQFEIEE